MLSKFIKWPFKKPKVKERDYTKYVIKYRRLFSDIVNEIPCDGDNFLKMAHFSYQAAGGLLIWAIQTGDVENIDKFLDDFKQNILTELKGGE